MNKIEILGKSSLSDQEIKDCINLALTLFELISVTVEIFFVDEEYIKKLNKENRQIDKPTDVLSFPQVTVPGEIQRHLGTIIICEEIVHEKEEDLFEVLKHGVLHLMGFDHEADVQVWDRAAKKINCNL